MSATSTLLQRAFDAHRRGDLEQARAAYEAVLARNPEQREALHYLGLLHFQQGRPSMALALMEKAGSRRAREPAWLEQLGAVYRELSHLAEAEACFRRALQLDPRSVPARGNLALTLEAQGRLEEARAAYETLLRQAPQLAATRVNLGIVLAKLGQHDAALAQYGEALRLAPDNPEAHLNLAVELLHRGEAEQALSHFDHALKHKPEDADAWIAAGRCLLVLGKAAAAARLFERALEIAPDNGDAAAQLATASIKQMDYEKALDICTRALERTPAHAGLQTQRGIALVDSWHAREGVRSLAHTVRLFPQHAGAWTAYLLDLHYVERDPARLWSAHVAYGRSLPARPLPTFARPPHARLRIGYVSPDFKSHPVAFFFYPILAAHDRTQFEVFCYYAGFSEDTVTEQLRAKADVWRRIAGREAEQVAELIRADEIDILVDLAGHTGDNRLDVFALRPAPIQVTYLGYPDTTGLPQMDYRITDAWADPPGMTERWHSEELVRLPSGFLCYEPPVDAPAVAPAPAVRLGFVSFGSFNNLNKVTPDMVAVWCRILHAVPNSRMVLKSSRGWSEQATVKERLLAAFASHGIPPERLSLLERTANMGEHLERYAEVDIALDTFPYHGTTTTFEALYMGVPVITLAGAMHCARVGVSILSRIGCEEWIAQSEDDYVAKAVALARKPARLAESRAGLRERLVRSGVTDRTRLTQELEAAYLEMWRRYEREGVRLAQLPSAPAMDEAPATPIAFGAGERVWVPLDPLLMTPYILLEQEDWFEDEIRFLRRAAQPGWRTLDIGANYGVYTTTLARAVGPAGHVWSVEPVGQTASHLARTLAEERLTQVTLVRAAVSDYSGEGTMQVTAHAELNQLGAGACAETVRVMRLDDLWHEAGKADLDFIKIDAEGQEAAILRGGSACLRETSPLILMEILHGRERNTEAVKLLRRAGYGLYRLVPGLMLLVPWEEQDPLAGADLNVFACKDDRANALAAEGLLARPGKKFPREALSGAGWAWIERRAYVAPLRDGWAASGKLPGAALVATALDHWAMAHEPSVAADARVAALHQALKLQQQALAASPTVTFRRNGAISFSA